MEAQEGPRRSSIVAAYVVALLATFLAGRGFESQTTSFTHGEVENMAAKCKAGDFIGECVQCTPCASFEFKAGGCTGFRDTFCTFCEPIKNCKRTNIACTTRYNSVCNKCECVDPIKTWGEIEKGKFEYEDMVVPKGKFIGDITHRCYWNDDCRGCSVCPKGQFETERCSQEKDTQCKACSTCKADEYVAKPCSYSSDTVCKPCTHCQPSLPGGFPGDYTFKRCTSASNKNIEIKDHFLRQGFDAVCKPCSKCFQKPEEKDGKKTGKFVPNGNFVKGVCKEFSNTKCQTCSKCRPGGAMSLEEMKKSKRTGKIPGQYQFNTCKSGSVLKAGSDTVCRDCSGRAEGYWEKEPCLHTGTTDAVYDECHECKIGTWQKVECMPKADIVCIDCSDAPRGFKEYGTPKWHCPKDKRQCNDPNDSTCVHCNKLETKWFKGTCCDEGFIGNECEYMQTKSSCGTDSYRSRTAKRGGFCSGKACAEKRWEDFTNWCSTLCNDFRSCTAFEVPSGDFKVTDDTVCHLKNKKSQVGSDEKVTCYSKLWKAEQILAEDKVTVKGNREIKLNDERELGMKFRKMLAKKKEAAAAPKAAAK